MGNYYEVVNFDKKERISDLPDWGIKWGSFSCGGHQMRVLAYLICNGPSDCIARDISGRWFGDRIGIVGDFSEVYSDGVMTEDFTDITPLLVEAFSKSPGGRAVIGLPDK